MECRARMHAAGMAVHMLAKCLLINIWLLLRFGVAHCGELHLLRHMRHATAVPHMLMCLGIPGCPGASVLCCVSRLFCHHPCIYGAFTHNLQQGSLFERAGEQVSRADACQNAEEWGLKGNST